MNDLIKFGRDRAGYLERKVTQRFGDLYIDGIIYLSNLPFALLNSEKQKLKSKGIIGRRITIKYHQQ